VSRILDAYPGGQGLPTATRADLRSLGATQKQAAALQGAFDLARRVQEHEFRYKAGVKQPSDVIGYVRAHMPSLEQESFLVLFLDARQRVIEMRETARGTVASVDVHPREVFRDAVRLRAHSVILAHNHPSGDPEASDHDVQLTQRLIEAGRVVGIPVLDHLIIGGEAAVSMAQMGFPGYGAQSA
jgi:DNA repair protein RadC